MMKKVRIPYFTLNTSSICTALDGDYDPEENTCRIDTGKVKVELEVGKDEGILSKKMLYISVSGKEKTGKIMTAYISPMGGCEVREDGGSKVLRCKLDMNNMHTVKLEINKDTGSVISTIDYEDILTADWF